MCSPGAGCLGCGGGVGESSARCCCCPLHRVGGDWQGCVCVMHSMQLLCFCPGCRRIHRMLPAASTGREAGKGFRASADRSRTCSQPAARGSPPPLDCLLAHRRHHPGQLSGPGEGLNLLTALLTSVALGCCSLHGGKKRRHESVCITPPPGSLRGLVWIRETAGGSMCQPPHSSWNIRGCLLLSQPLGLLTQQRLPGLAAAAALQGFGEGGSIPRLLLLLLPPPAWSLL